MITVKKMVPLQGIPNKFFLRYFSIQGLQVKTSLSSTQIPSHILPLLFLPPCNFFQLEGCLATPPSPVPTFCSLHLHLFSLVAALIGCYQAPKPSCQSRAWRPEQMAGLLGHLGCEKQSSMTGKYRKGSTDNNTGISTHPKAKLSEIPRQDKIQLIIPQPQHPKLYQLTQKFTFISINH